MDQDQTAPLGAVWSGIILFASMNISSLKFTWINAADIKSKQHFQDKKIVVEYLLSQNTDFNQVQNIIYKGLYKQKPIHLY